MVVRVPPSLLARVDQPTKRSCCMPIDRPSAKTANAMGPAPQSAFVPRDNGGPSAAVTAAITASDSIPKASSRVEPVDSSTRRRPSPSSASWTRLLGIAALSLAVDAATVLESPAGVSDDASAPRTVSLCWQAAIAKESMRTAVCFIEAGGIVGVQYGTLRVRAAGDLHKVGCTWRSRAACGRARERVVGVALRRSDATWSRVRTGNPLRRPVTGRATSQRPPRSRPKPVLGCGPSPLSESGREAPRGEQPRECRHQDRHRPPLLDRRTRRQAPRSSARQLPDRDCPTVGP